MHINHTITRAILSGDTTGLWAVFQACADGRPLPDMFELFCGVLIARTLDDAPVAAGSCEKTTANREGN